MTTYTWTTTTGSGLSWASTANWSSTTVPGSSDTALINQAGTYGITFDGTGSLGGLTMSDANATLSFINNSVTVLGTTSLTAGRISISGGGIANAKTSNNSTLSITGGSLTESGGTAEFGTGGISISAGTADITGGSFSTTGALTVSKTGDLDLASGSATSVTGNTQVNGGTVTVAGTLNTGTLTVASGQLVTMSGSGLVDVTAAGASNSGTISGAGKISGAVSGTGSLVASGGTLDITGAVSGQSLTIDDNSMLQLGTTVGSGDTAIFAGTSSEVLILNSQTAGTLNVNNFFSGDTINVGGATGESLSNGNTLIITGTSGTLDTLLLNKTYTAGQISQTGSTFTTSLTVCFAAGSRIRTEQGDVPVEQLAEGQRVAVLRDGAVAFTPITWIGQRRINLAAHPQPQTAAPVRIMRGAIGENLPERDLVLSPDHCLFLDGKLIPAKSLINGMTIVQERSLPSVHYFHVEVDPHAVLLAEGLPVESYLDTGNRAYFENAGAALVLHPEFTINAGLKAWETHACAPLTVAPDAVRPVWQRLAERAEAMGFVAAQPETTQDADLHLVADGRAIRPMSQQGGRYVFALPAGCDSVRLVSRASIPSDLTAYLDDWRALGVAVSGLTVRTRDGQQVIPADHPALARGWHKVETDGATSWRWTDGNAELNLSGSTGSMILEVQVCHTARYIVDAAEQAQRQLAA